MKLACSVISIPIYAVLTAFSPFSWSEPEPATNLDFILPIKQSDINSVLPNANGITIFSELGTRVSAIEAGKVVYMGNLENYPNLVIINHDSIYLSAYAYLNTIDVKETQFIQKGEKIGESTDRGTLFEIRKSGKPVSSAELSGLLDWQH